MNSVATADSLDVVGIAGGVFLVLVGLGTLAGQPWQYANSSVVTVAQLLGSVGAIAVGAALAWLLYSTE